MKFNTQTTGIRMRWRNVPF